MYDQGEVDAIFRIAIEEKLIVKWSSQLLNERFTESDINLIVSCSGGIGNGQTTAIHTGA
jgi:hypothetical protein